MRLLAVFSRRCYDYDSITVQTFSSVGLPSKLNEWSWMFTLPLCDVVLHTCDFSHVADCCVCTFIYLWLGAVNWITHWDESSFFWFLKHLSQSGKCMFHSKHLWKTQVKKQKILTKFGTDWKCWSMVHPNNPCFEQKLLLSPKPNPCLNSCCCK